MPVDDHVDAVLVEEVASAISGTAMEPWNAFEQHAVMKTNDDETDRTVVAQLGQADSEPAVLGALGGYG